MFFTQPPRSGSSPIIFKSKKSKKEEEKIKEKSKKRKSKKEEKIEGIAERESSERPRSRVWNCRKRVFVVFGTTEIGTSCLFPPKNRSEKFLKRPRELGG
ncbi:hypothetical protein U1Q18_025949 [Sarracenia purpurea var. burkii]